MDLLQALRPNWLDAFAWPWLLLAIPLPWLARRLLPALPSQSAALRVPWGERLDAIAQPGGQARVRGVGWLAWLAWLLLCLAAARPQALGEIVRPPQQGRDLMLAIDLSGSMDDQDMRIGDSMVDRLTAAKAVMADFLERRGGDRIGMIVFGQRAYVATPMTLDHDSVRQQLADTVVGLAGRETALGDAIGLAVKRLQNQPTPQRVLILLTDGVNTAGVLEPEKAAQLARDAGVRIHTIAFGGDGQSVSIFGMQLQLPGMGEGADEEGLREIANATGGQAFRARDVAELAGIYREIDRLEPVARQAQAVRPRIEKYPQPLLAALACALLALGWRAWRSR